MKNSLWYLGVMVLLSGVSAQDGRSIVQQAEKKIEAIKTLEVAMEGRVQTGQMSQQISGTMLYKKPNKFRMVMKVTLGGQSPAIEQHLYSDGKNLWMYMPGMNQYIKRAAPKNLQEKSSLGQAAQSSPLMLFSEKPSRDKETTFKLIKSTNLEGKEVQVVEARPKNPQKGLASGSNPKFLLYIGKNDSLIYKVEYFDSVRQQRMDAQGKVQMSEMKIEADVVFNYRAVNKPISDSTFAFKPPAGAKEFQPLTPPGVGAPPPKPR